MTKISVCMATYNGAKYIKEQMDSILNQKFVENPDTEMEIIISDDGSTDGTLDILKEYNNPKIMIFHHKAKRRKYYGGMFACTANFGHALSLATGDYIFMSDQDDIWYSNKLDKTLSLLKEKGGVCAAAFHVVSEDKKIKYGTNYYKKEPLIRLKKKYPLYGFSCGFTKKMLKYIIPMPIVPAHDVYIMWLAYFCNKLYFVNEPLAEHRWSGSHNVSAIKNDSPFIIKNYYRAKMIILPLIKSFIYRIFG